jgi:hypothetical protein
MMLVANARHLLHAFFAQLLMINGPVVFFLMEIQSLIG